MQCTVVALHALGWWANEPANQLDRTPSAVTAVAKGDEYSGNGPPVTERSRENSDYSGACVYVCE